jgi:hypothetical protein
VNDLRGLAALQARVYEFLEQQDENTLRAIADGTARLAVVHAGDARPPAGPEPREDSRIAELTVKELRKVASQRGLVGYSKLKRAELINLLTGSDQAEEQQAVTQEAEPSTATAKPTVDTAAIAARLRETETEEEGAAYLHAQHLDRDSLLAVAAELQLTRVNRLSQTELEKRLLKQAIGARRKFDGLRRW